VLLAESTRRAGPEAVPGRCQVSSRLHMGRACPAVGRSGRRSGGVRGTAAYSRVCRGSGGCKLVDPSLPNRPPPPPGLHCPTSWTSLTRAGCSCTLTARTCSRCVHFACRSRSPHTVQSSGHNNTSQLSCGLVLSRRPSFLLYSKPHSPPSPSKSSSAKPSIS
jgi:hypothetical protein